MGDRQTHREKESPSGNREEEEGRAPGALGRWVGGGQCLRAAQLDRAPRGHTGTPRLLPHRAASSPDALAEPAPRNDNHPAFQLCQRQRPRSTPSPLSFRTLPRGLEIMGPIFQLRKPKVKTVHLRRPAGCRGASGSLPSAPSWGLPKATALSALPPEQDSSGTPWLASRPPFLISGFLREVLPAMSSLPSQPGPAPASWGFCTEPGLGQPGRRSVWVSGRARGRGAHRTGQFPLLGVVCRLPACAP